MKKQESGSKKRQRKEGNASRKARRQKRQEEESSSIVYDLPGGFQMVMRHLSTVADQINPLDLFGPRAPEWEGWNSEYQKGGWVLHKPGCKEAVFLDEALIVGLVWILKERMTKLGENLDPLQRRFFARLEELDKIKSGLQKPFWSALLKSKSEICVRLIKSIMYDPAHQSLIEDVQDNLEEQGLGWEQIETLHRIDERNLDWLEWGLRRPGEVRSALRKRWRRYDRSAKQILSREAPFSDAVKKRLRKEHERLKIPVGFDKQSIQVAEENVKTAVKKLMGNSRLAQKTDLSMPSTATKVWNIFIVQLVAELESAGFSKRKSFDLTDKILHVLCPRYWPEPDGYSAARVRLRFYYWSRKK